jgi:CRP-like cAMP-binding protein
MRRNDPKIERLAGLPLFAACSRRELEQLAEAADVVSLKAGSVVMRQGAVAHEVFVVVDGELEVSRGGSVVATLRPGDHFGEVGVLAGAPRDATVTTRTDVELFTFEQRRFMVLVERMLSVNRTLLRDLADRLHDADMASPSTTAE